MTPQTAKDLAELGMTPEQMQERQSKLGEILHGSATSFDPATVEAMPTPPARTRQPRSDKGTTRPPKAMQAAVEAPAQRAVLTAEQAERIHTAIEEEFAAREALAEAEDRLARATAHRWASVNSLIASK